MRSAGPSQKARRGTRAGRRRRQRGDPVRSVRSGGFSRPPLMAAEQLQAALAQRGFAVQRCARLDKWRPPIFAFSPPVPFRPGPRSRGAGAGGRRGPGDRSPAIWAAGPMLVASGGRVRGSVYALTELAARWRTIRMRRCIDQSLGEKPANAVRSVMRSLPARSRTRLVYDRDSLARYRYCSMLVAQRFQPLSTWLSAWAMTRRTAPRHLSDFAYPFLRPCPVRGCGRTNLPDAERDRNLEMLRFISDEAALRGLDPNWACGPTAYEWTIVPRPTTRSTG